MFSYLASSKRAMSYIEQSNPSNFTHPKAKITKIEWWEENLNNFF